MRVFFIILFILITSFLFSQKDYTPLKCNGKIPADFLISSQEKYLHDKATIKKDERSRVRKDKNNFYIYTNYKIDFLLRSGMVLFGDEATKYVNEVGKYVLKDYPELKDKIRFYVIKSPEVNAFSTYQGIVFVNLGLLAQVENEAQLAYILAHEIIHYKNNHVIKSYLNTQDIINNSGKYNNLSYNQEEHAYFNYSKNQEMEADSQGLSDFYLKTDYDINEVLNVFDVLLYSYLPIDEVPFDTTFFNDEYFTLPTKVFKKELSPISAIEDYDDSKSTHPNIKKRRTKIYNIIADLDNVKEGKKYIISEDKFKNVQKKARFEMSQLYLTSIDYDKSFYNTYILLQKYPNSVYLKKKMAYALYGIAKFSNYQTLSDAITSERKTEGNIQQIPHFFRKLKREQRTIIAIKYAWEKYDETKDKYFKNIATDLMYDLFKLGNKTPGYFAKIIKTEKDTFKEISQEEYLKLSKYQKIKYDKQKKIYSKNKNKKNDIWKYALVNQRNNKEFNDSFETAYNNATKDKETEDIAYSKKKKRRKRIALSIDTITLVTPSYEVFFDNKKDFLNGDNKKQNFIKDINDNAKRTNLTVIQQSIDDLNENQVDKFNKISAINFWLYEYFNQQKYDDIWDITPSQQDNIQDFAKKNKYFAITGIVSNTYSRSKTEKNRAIINMLAIIPIPYSIYILTTKRHYTSFYIILFDSKKGKYVYKKVNHLQTKDYNYVLNMNLYDVFYKIKSKPKK